MRKSFWIVGILVFTFVLSPSCDYEGNFHLINKVAAQTAIGVTVDKTISIFNASSLDGQSIEVGVPGKPYVLNFWATWCPPCRDEFPELNQFANAHIADIQFYAINIQESGEQVSGFLNSNGYALPVLLDIDGSITRNFRIRTVPTTIVVDSQGVIRYRKSGGVTVNELENVLNGL